MRAGWSCGKAVDLGGGLKHFVDVDLYHCQGSDPTVRSVSGLGYAHQDAQAPVARDPQLHAS